MKTDGFSIFDSQMISYNERLTPDGQRMAVVHADADKITLIDAQHLTVERTFSLDRRTSLLDWFAPQQCLHLTCKSGAH